jgi:WXG100 family type VII secretion target
MDVDRDGVIRVGERINGAQSEFTRKAGELESALGRMVTDWQGEGGGAFGKLMLEWQGRQATITKLLQRFEDSLTTTQLTSVEQDSTQAMNMFAVNKNLNQ